jgi:hypothetical protein
MMTFFTNPELTHSLLAPTASAVGILRLCLRTAALRWHRDEQGMHAKTSFALSADRSGARMYRRTSVSIYLILFLVQAGCATASPVIPARSNELREGFGAIAVTTGQATPKVKFHPPKHVKGAGAAAGRTSGRALGKMWSGCGQVAAGTAETIIVPFFVLAGCIIGTPFAAVGGALVGGGNSAAAEANRAASAAREPEVRALRGVVNPALSALASEKPLQARLLEQVATRTQSAVVTVPQTGRPHYKKLLRNGIDTVLEAGVVRIDVSTENAFVLTARVRLIRLADREELYANTPTFTIASRSVSEWTTDGGEALQAALVRAYQALADEIVDALVGKNHSTTVARDPAESEQARRPQQIVTSAKNASAPKTPSANSKATHPRGLPQQAASTPRTDSPIEVSKAGVAATPTPSAAIPKDAASKHYKIGIFPAAGNFGQENRGTQEERSADILREEIGQASALELTYSFYHSELNVPAIRVQGSVWAYDGNDEKPKVSAIRELGRERNLDGVVLAFGDTPGGWGFGLGGENPQNPVTLYMVNTKTGQVYLRKGTFADVHHMAEEVFADFLKNRPEAVRAKAAPAAK